MKMFKSRRGRIRLISILTTLIVVLAVFGTVEHVEAKNYATNVRVSQQRALSELSSYMESIHTNLKKGAYASSSPMLATIAAQLWMESTAAKNALSELPAQHSELINTYKFLSQVGDYTMSLNEKAARGETVTAKEAESLFSLKDIAGALSEQIAYLLSEQQLGNLDFTNSKKKVQTIGEAADTAKINFSGALTDAEESLSEYPTLIYDGPFSDHINKKEPALTKGKKIVSADSAKQTAAEYLNVKADTLSGGEEENSILPCYLFNGADFTIAVTKRGGYVCYLLSSRYAGEEKLSQTEATDIAQKYLKNHGFDNMKESYFSSSDGICTVNFSYVQDGVVCYTDLIKVSVALDTGDVLSVDARGYIMNHKKHDIPSSTRYSMAGAQKLLSSFLKVNKAQKAIIPTDSETEKFTYEYYCTGKDGQELLVYLNPKTGYEEEILILLYTDGGVLTK